MSPVLVVVFVATALYFGAYKVISSQRREQILEQNQAEWDRLDQEGKWRAKIARDSDMLI